MKGIHDLGYLHPTPVQEQAIPPILQGGDLIVCAQTGSGKTAAFVLPILHRLMENPAKKPGVRALIVAPTRELAVQSTEHLGNLSRFVPLRGLAIYGGVPMYPQTKALKEGVEIISATPGRLLDHVYEGRIDFGALEVLVLDEADRMMDMGFLPDVERIISLLPPKRQTLIVSATMPEDILRLVKKITHNPKMVQVGLRTSTAAGIRHAVYLVSHEQKTDLLLRLLNQQGETMSSVIVFTRTKVAAEKLGRTLERAGIRTATIHGDRSQQQRTYALDHFKQGRSQVLVATDVAARGIDVKDISHVINFHMPQTAEDYIHRAGRTARAGAEGDAFSLVAPDEEEMLNEIEKIINQKLPRVTLPDFPYGKGAAPQGRPQHRQGQGGHGRPQHGGQGGGGPRRHFRGGQGGQRPGGRPSH
ncbi:MAG TPA: DEAD/DEAH box helicase [Candidatus Eisenbacteria bacterium]|nr:DEAD/DEAH box helicase [Candidatus Eisenbacteria bacterium]